MTDVISPKEPDSPREPRVTPPVDGGTGRYTSGGETREELEVSDVALRALSQVAGAGDSLPSEAKVFEGLGCPLEDARKIVGKGYLAEYQRHLSKMPEAAAQALLCLMISQDPDIGVDLRKKISPEISKGGTGGVYFLKNFNGDRTFVFKPQNEEPFMPAWPKVALFSDFNPAEPDYPIRLSVRGGRGSQNEVIAARIAKEFHLDVPETYLVRPRVSVTEKFGVLAVYREDREDFLAATRKEVATGSLQEFKPGITMAEINTFRQVFHIYSKLYGGLEETTWVNARMMLFDFVCGNADRNVGNVLIDQLNRKMYPIDHGLCFPDGLSLDALGRRGYIVNETDFRPLVFAEEEGTISELSLEFCRDLNAGHLASIMREGGALESSIEEMQMRVRLVKILAERRVPVVEMKDFFQFKEKGQSPIELIANKALISLGLTQDSLKGASDADKRALFPSYLEEFERQVYSYLAKTDS